MTPSPSTPHPRLRLTCDNCSEAKIKCDKQRPACNRCTKNGFTECTYSVSRRYGKPSLAKRIARERERAVAEARVAHSRQSSTTLNESRANGIHADFLMTLGDGAAWEPDAIPLTTLWPDFDLDTFGTSSVTPLISSTLTENIILGSLHSSTKAWDTIIEHDCEARAISILRSLQQYSAGPIEPSPPNPSLSITMTLPTTEIDLVPSFDGVLSANKKALTGWSEMMKCPCAQCPHLAFLYASIPWKLLFWYRVAAMGNETPQTSSKSLLEPRPEIGTFSVKPTTVNVGVLDLDPQDQVGLRRALLRGELKKMERMIDVVMGVGDIEENSAQQVVKWCGLGIPQLRAELRNVINYVK